MTIMANRQRAEARRKAAAKASRKEGGAKKTWMWVTIAVVVVAAVVAIVVATGGKDSNTPAADGSTPTTVQSVIPDSQPATVTGTALPDYQTTGADAAIGKVAPTVEGLNFAGQKVSLNPSGGPYMVVFLAHWCPHCNAEVPRLLNWKHSGAVPAGLNVVGVATAVSKSSVNYPPSTWFSNKGWEWPVMVDTSQGDGAAGKVAQAFGATGWPYLVLVGKDGKVKMRTSGEVAIADLQKMVDAALKA
jgi:cytochrome c biogenesis protein CcmG/thiol:disulfide interchange protein DsbE